jgi:hypothetical protein
MAAAFGGRSRLLALWGWAIAVALLHSSPLLQGYHFVFQLYPPICLLAAPALLQCLRAIRGATLPAARLLALGAALFLATPMVTLESVSDLWRRNLLPQEQLDLALRLAELPAGNVLAPPELGNLIPALAGHRVYVGQWFLTPSYASRARRYWSLMNQPARGDALRKLVTEQRIDYLIAPSRSAARLAPELLEQWPVLARRQSFVLLRTTSTP